MLITTEEEKTLQIANTCILGLEINNILLKYVHVRTCTILFPCPTDGWRVIWPFYAKQGTASSALLLHRPSKESAWINNRL